MTEYECDHQHEIVTCDCGGYLGEACIYCGDMHDGGDHMAQHINCTCPPTCDNCGDIAPTTLWRKYMADGWPGPGYHYLNLCADCDNGPDMDGFEFVEAEQ